MINKRKKIIIASLLVTITYILLVNYTQFAKASEGKSTIAGIIVEDLTTSEIKEKLYTVIEEWQSEPFVITGNDIKITIDTTMIEYDVNRTVDTYEQMTRTPTFAFWKKAPVVHLPIEMNNTQLLKDSISHIKVWDIQPTFEKLVEQASYFGFREIEAEIKDASLLEKERIAFLIEPIPYEAFEIEKLIKALDGTVLNQLETLSIIESLGKNIGRANDVALNFLASTMYSLALQTNSEIKERHSQNVIPTYLEPGIEAQIDVANSKDLKFMHTQKDPIKYKLSIVDGDLLVEAYSYAKMKTAKIEVTEDHTVKNKKITRFTQKLAPGTTELISKGRSGLRVTVVRYGTEKSESVIVSKDYYEPTHEIILKSSKVEEKSETDNQTDENEVADTDKEVKNQGKEAKEDEKIAS